MKKVGLLHKKLEPSHVDPFLLNNHPDEYIEDFRGLPKTDTLENAKETISVLKKLKRKYAKNKGGLRHVHLITEIGEHQALLKGKPELSSLYTKFLGELSMKKKASVKKRNKKN